MRIKSFRVTNYKSFEDSGEHELAPHMNVIVGQNNVGKTALLQAISQRLADRPHRNSRQRRQQAVNPISHLELNFVATGREVSDAIMIRGDMKIPVSQQWRNNSELFLKVPEILISASYRPNNWLISRFPSNNVENPIAVRTFAPNRERQRVELVDGDYAVDPQNDTFGPKMGPVLNDRTYLFDALRAPAAKSPAGSNAKLNSNAGNLPEVLSTFQPNRTLYKHYVDQVRRVLPLVKWIGVTPIGGEIEIRVWNVEEDTTRDDLAIPLSECGTGIGQVLAILYVIIRSAGDIICIDEPNSFLHPGAAKALMTILNEHPEHQYIIATHSPEVIRAAYPEKLFMLGFQEEATVITELDQSDVNSGRHMLDEIGSRFSDVFGTDAVIWVEGPTEEECFPLLLKAQGITLPNGTVIARLRSTGDLEGKRAKACGDIYRNLSAAGSILPHNVTIILDGDKRDNPHVRTLEEVFNTEVRFLPRRMYECYLLHSQAVADLLNTLPSFKDEPVTPDKIDAWMRAEGSSIPFGAPTAAVFSEEWLKQVDAAKLLTKLFQAISDAKESYSKTEYAPWLTRWLIEKDPAFLAEVSKYVTSLIE